MLNLIKLELKKFKMQGNLKVVIIINLVIFTLFSFIGIMGKFENEVTFIDFNMALSLIDVLTKATFMIYASVLLSQLVIEEYRSKTIDIMFMYPISRKKIFASKFIIVSTFTFISIVLSNLFLRLAFGVMDHFIDIIPGTFSINILIENNLMLLINAMLASIISLIPLFFGMRKKSVSTTIVAGVLLASIICSNNGGFSLSSILPITISLAAVGLLVGGGVLRKLDRNDVL